MDPDFGALVERHRGELRVHCYRMLGSLDEADDLVQETFLKAWRGRDGFAGRSSVRAWLYRIATNACLDALDGRERRVLPYDLSASSPPGEVLWLEPWPDQPDAAVVDRETIEIAFLAAIQHLPPRQRAALILTDVLGWPAHSTADALTWTTAGVNSALQRARATLRTRLPSRRADWTAARPSPDEQAVLRTYMDAVERADVAAVAELLAAEVRATMPPWPITMRGRDEVVAALTTSWNPASPSYVGRFRLVPLTVNGQPGAASYTDGRAFAIGVLRIADGRIVELTAFHDTTLFPKFGLPMTIPAGDRLNVFTDVPERRS